MAPCLLKIQSFGAETGVDLLSILRSCADNMLRLSAVPTKCKGIQVIVIEDNLAAVVAGKLSVLTFNSLRGCTSVFLSGFISIALTVFEYHPKAAKI